MERIEDHIEDALIDLGAVSRETQGGPYVLPEISEEQPRAGIDAD
ncbi:benenodin family lasso peptide [Caulobacter sp. CCNWLY153]|uniref:Benenodin family lasso peptide n=1 Tax=Caulobacter radicis TaxID=2172650 RepID=A0A2T9JB01_9CAUL|nr:benenodin family lasso peptide [Caulobacter radicis]PVM79394.1 hypothetical protein DDF65_14940 [Caulobacter radicis]PVM83546.1 hypothetical protein DDF62_24900 [Caulobacter radicis]